jgi:hypothetical protein
MSKVMRLAALGWTVSPGYQYPFSTQSHRVARCRWVSSRIQNDRFELAEIEPGLQSALDPPNLRC